MLEGVQELSDVHSSPLILFLERVKVPGCHIIMKKLEANNIEFEFHHPTRSVRHF